MMQVGVVGLGSIAPVHIQALLRCEGVSLVSGCDVDVRQRLVLPKGARFYESHEEMAAKQHLDAVHICLPHDLHFPMAKAFAEKGIHIFLEKPPALSAKDTEALCQLERRYGVQICVCLQNRLNATTQALKKALDSGMYGKVKSLRGIMLWHRPVEYYMEKPWRGERIRAGGGCLINQALHTLDLLAYFAGQPTLCVKASYLHLMEPGLEVEDSVMARLCFAEGIDGLFIATVTNDEDEDVQIKVRCEQATFTIENKALYLEQKGERRLLASDGAAGHGKRCYGNSHEALIADFYSALQGTARTFPHPEDSLPVMRLLDAITVSSTRKECVEI